jgi:hypothetical protein
MLADHVLSHCRAVEPYGMREDVGNVPYRYRKRKDVFVEVSGGTIQAGSIPAQFGSAHFFGARTCPSKIRSLLFEAHIAIVRVFVSEHLRLSISLQTDGAEVPSVAMFYL